MHCQLRLSRARARRPMAILTVALAGFGTAALVGIAAAKTFTLANTSDAAVTNTKGVTVHEGVVVNAHGFAAYALSGDTVHHPKCTKANGCFKFWPPVKVASAKKLTKAPGVKGKLGVWHRNGFSQVTLGGHPLYTFANDKHKGAATGEGIKGFGGTWHVSRTSGPKGQATTTPSTSPPSTSTPTGTGSTSTGTATYPPPTTSTTTTNPYPYPPTTSTTPTNPYPYPPMN